jgi:hypothetical protein
VAQDTRQEKRVLVKPFLANVRVKAKAEAVRADSLGAEAVSFVIPSLVL